MVMRNRHEGGGPPHGWGDLPPRLRRRFTPPLNDPPRLGAAEAAPPQPPPPSRGDVLVDLSRFAAVFVLVSALVLLYLLLALSFIAG